MSSTEYMRIWRERNRIAVREYNRHYNKKWRKENGYHNETKSKDRYPEKINAQKILQKAVKLGKIKRLPCRVCGSIRSQAHHDDYTAPLDVKWFCALHHNEYHATIRRLKKNDEYREMLKK